MVTTAPLWQASDSELVDAYSAVVQRRRQLYAEELRLLAEMESRGVATKLGYSNTSALLMHTARLSRAEARHRLAQAQDLHAMTTPTGSVIEPVLPQTAEALARGEVGSEHVDVIRKTLANLPHLDAEQRATAEQVMLTRAAEDDPKALTRFGTRVRDIVDPDGPPPREEQPARPARMLRRHIRRDGTMEFKGHLDLESAQLFENLLKPFEKPHTEGGDTRGYAERAGDAFADVLRMAANCPELPTQNGVRTEVAVTISFEELQRALDDVVLSGDRRMSASEARRIACDAHVLPAVLGGDSKPLDVAVPAYTTPAHIRRGLYLRDKGCSFPSCERPASVCDAHHVVPWAQGGPTKLDNLASLCPSHHRLIHNSAWTVEMVDGRPWFTPPAYVDPSQRPRRNELHAPLPRTAA
ncbi:HNH endonuclease signature motif containing protein [Actinocrispum wychmicini]|uniref:HNH endonuclease n=1 Tax=Actinocrispum wychmicini TaxID=1213861 RepID=A0A4R2JFG7_9PSEU|nr:HNH endonuclease signature motif containing protein [Actinocrispum wychmicini]TCO55019.1 HNH endonuclease [Actinocrispum wychmicini]